MKPREAILKLFGIFFLCFLVLFTTHFDLFGSSIAKFLIVSFATLKSLLFVYQNFKKIKESKMERDVYFNYLIFLGGNIILVIISFAMDFFTLYEVNNASFQGIPSEFSLGEKVFEFFFYSILNMTNFGFGEVIPVTLAAKTITSLEVILSFVAIIFVLSDFMSLRDSIINRKPQK